MAQFITYTKFFAPEDAQYLITLLQQHNIPYSFEHEVNQLDKVYIGESVEPMFELKVPPTRFNDVDNVLAAQARSDMFGPDFKHYLQDFSTEELQEIVDEPDTWNAYDVQVATELLSKRTGGSNAKNINRDILKEPAKVDRVWIILGYMNSISGLSPYLPFVFGAVGFFGGLAILASKKTLKTGETIKMYSKQDRRHGRNMVILSIVCTIIGSLIFYFEYAK